MTNQNSIILVGVFFPTHLKIWSSNWIISPIFGMKTKNPWPVGGWTDPVEKYARQNGFIFPNFRGEHKKYLSCHHLENIWPAKLNINKIRYIMYISSMICWTSSVKVFGSNEKKQEKPWALILSSLSQDLLSLSLLRNCMCYVLCCRCAMVWVWYRVLFLR